MGHATIQMLPGTPITSGSTFEEYVQSVKDNGIEEFWQNYNVNSSLFRYQIEKVGYVPGFLDYFHRSEFRLQKRILYILKNGKCVWSTALYLKMIHDTGSDWKAVKEWKSGPYSDWSMPYCDGDNGMPSESFGIVSRGFLWSLSDRHNTEAGSKIFPTVDAQTLTLLARKHGESKIMEIIDLWMKARKNLPNTFYDFCQLVEEWDRVKGYPIEWTLNVIGTHQCKESVQDD